MSRRRDELVKSAARAIDRAGLLDRGWTDEEICAAFALTPHPSKAGIRMAKEALKAVWPFIVKEDATNSEADISARGMPCPSR